MNGVCLFFVPSFNGFVHTSGTCKKLPHIHTSVEWWNTFFQTAIRKLLFHSERFDVTPIHAWHDMIRMQVALIRNHLRTQESVWRCCAEGDMLQMQGIRSCKEVRCFFNRFKCTAAPLNLRPLSSLMPARSHFSLIHSCSCRKKFSN